MLPAGMFCCSSLGLGGSAGRWEGAGAELEMRSVGVCCRLPVEQEESGKDKGSGVCRQCCKVSRAPGFGDLGIPGFQGVSGSS